MNRPKSKEEVVFQNSVKAIDEDSRVRFLMREMIKGSDVGLDMYAHVERNYTKKGFPQEVITAGLWACSLGVTAQWSREVGDLFPKGEWDKICMEEGKRGEA